MRIKKFFIACLILAVMFVCVSCSPKTSAETTEIFAMDTVIKLTVYGENAKEAVAEAKKLIYQYDNQFSVNKKESDIAKINAANGEYVAVKEDTYELIQKSIEISDMTDGAFDISIYPVVKAWGFTGDNRHVPGEETKERVKKLVDYKKIDCKAGNSDSSNRYQVKIEKDMSIDLGGIAKGYISQKIVQKLKEMHVESAIISLGGNVETLGKKPDGSNYCVGITNPFSDDALIGTIEAENQSVITSGNYERFFEQDGVRYHHIMDKETAAPAEHGLSSVTVIGEDGTLCDGLSTALFVMGKEKALEFQKKHPEFNLILVTNDGEITSTTPNFVQTEK